MVSSSKGDEGEQNMENSWEIDRGQFIKNPVFIVIKCNKNSLIVNGLILEWEDIYPEANLREDWRLVPDVCMPGRNLCPKYYKCL
jgi:hypothetical protein